MLTWEFEFRIKGSFFYSANHLIEQKLLQSNQTLKLIPEPNNPFDANAITLWLPFERLTPNTQTHQLLEHEKSLVRLSQFHYLHRLPTKLSLKLPTHLSTRLPATLSIKFSEHHSSSPWTRLSRNQVAFAQLHWQFSPHQWLIGYLPRDLAKLLAPYWKNNKKSVKSANHATDSHPNCELQLTHIKSAGIVFAKLHLKLSVISSLSLGSHLLVERQSRQKKDFSWKLKLLA